MFSGKKTPEAPPSPCRPSALVPLVIFVVAVFGDQRTDARTGETRKRAASGWIVDDPGSVRLGQSDQRAELSDLDPCAGWVQMFGGGGWYKCCGAHGEF